MWRVMKKNVELGPDFLAATKSVFGWTIHGISNPSNPPHDISTLMIGVEPSEPEPLPDEDQIEFDLREFWRLEHMGVLETEETEPSFLENYEESISQKPDGRCVACLPWKDN